MKRYLRPTNRLLGMLGECYYKEYCEQYGDWAYSSLEQIHTKEINDGKIEFKSGFQRFQIKIPTTIMDEIKKLSTPSLVESNSPAYVYDFFACKLYHGDEDKTEILNREINDFAWVEVKSGQSKLSPNQRQAISETQIPVMLCRVEGVLYNRPENVGMEFSRLYSKDNTYSHN